MSERAARDVVAVGNAIVDVIASVDDDFLIAHGVTKDAMTLIDQERAGQLYDAMPPARELSGGSAANTVVGVASLGGSAGYMGKVADDQLGAVFAHDIRAAGVAYDTPPLRGGEATARSLILVTPDANRSMNTFLGASALFDAGDVDVGLIESATYLYLEGYLFDRDEAKRAFVHAAEVARAAGRKTALTLSDSFCVERHRDSFLHLVRNHIDVLFANETELLSLYEARTFEAALEAIRTDRTLAFLTRSELGSVIVAAGEVVTVPAAPIDGVLVDATGAGDQYAAGALFGLARGLPLAECGRIAATAAAEVISHYGARPETRLADLVG